MARWIYYQRKNHYKHRDQIGDRCSLGGSHDDKLTEVKLRQKLQKLLAVKMCN